MPQSGLPRRDGVKHTHSLASSTSTHQGSPAGRTPAQVQRQWKQSKPDGRTSKPLAAAPTLPTSHPLFLHPMLLVGSSFVLYSAVHTFAILLAIFTDAKKGSSLISPKPTRSNGWALVVCGISPEFTLQTHRSKRVKVCCNACALRS